mmetsp:Transcript_6981/g.11218  ORF Transcript_6981/g.11218 Transcript_6981/m.11218 type:complete len:396 (+) Transcript_6981:2910-4097(+)
MHRQANGVKVVGVDHVLPSSGADMSIVTRTRQHVGHLGRNRLGVEEVDQQAGFPMGDRLAHRSHVAGHNGGAHRHAFQRRPGQHEGHREVEVAAADLDDLLVVLIGHLPQKMQPVPIEQMTDLGLHLAAQPAGVFRLAAIGRVIATDHEDAGIGPRLLQMRQRPHELVVAPRGFQIAGHESHDLVLDREGAAQTAQRHLGLFVGLEFVGADAVMAHIDPVMETGGKAVALPHRGTVAQIDDLDIGQRDGIVPLHQEGRVVGGRRAWVKAHRAAGDRVVVFKKPNHRRIGQHFAEERHLAPSDMANHDVGLPAGGKNFAHRYGRSKPIARRIFPGLGQPVGVVARLVMRLVDDCAHPFEFRGFLSLGEKDDLVLTKGGQPLDQFAVLAGHVLMNKE